MKRVRLAVQLTALIACSFISLGRLFGQGLVYFSDSRLLRLEDHWELYWNRFLDPAKWSDRIEAGAPPGRNVIDGGFWDTEGFPTQGFASFRVELVVPEGGARIGFLLRDTLSAYEFFVNGESLGQNGKASSDPSLHRGSLRMRVFYSELPEGTTELLFHLSNYVDSRSGFRHSPMVGAEGAVRRRATFLRLSDALILLFITGIGVVHIVRSRGKGGNAAALYFGIFSLVIALRGGLTGARLLHDVFDFLPLNFLVDLELIVVYFAAFLLNKYMVTLFPKHEIRLFSNILMICVLVLPLYALVVPIELNEPVHLVFEIIMILEAGVLSFYLIKGWQGGSKAAKAMLPGLLVLSVTVVNDVLYDLSGRDGVFLVPYGLLVFLLLQALFLRTEHWREGPRKVRIGATPR